MWTYHQNTGIITNGTLHFTGYSGALGYVNIGNDDNIAMKGPIPKGNYSIGSPVDDPKTGIYSMPLTPATTNEMYGRSEFRLHGDNKLCNHSASEGCIILFHAARVAIWESGDHELEVVE